MCVRKDEMQKFSRLNALDKMFMGGNRDFLKLIYYLKYT